MIAAWRAGPGDAADSQHARGLSWGGREAPVPFSPVTGGCGLRGGGARSARRWEPRSPDSWVPAPSPAPPPAGPRPRTALAVGGRGRGVPGSRKSLSPLPRQRAMLVSPLSCGVRRVAVFNRGGCSGGSGRRAPRRAGGAGGERPQSAGRPARRGARAGEERRNSGGNCDCASAAS